VSDFNTSLIEQIRAGGGHLSDGPFAGRQVLILTTTGAKSGQSRETPLVYSRDGDNIVIIASMGGAPSHPSWYHNIVANPRVTIEVDGKKLQADAHIAEGDERRRLYDQHADLHDSFTEYEAKTGGRVIPVIVLQDVKATAAA
jgi:deazaflavin-dependent oxidoreductase (nitroreductase family)